jgi:hypothetical protein
VYVIVFASSISPAILSPLSIARGTVAGKTSPLRGAATANPLSAAFISPTSQKRALLPAGDLSSTLGSRLEALQQVEKNFEACLNHDSSGLSVVPETEFSSAEGRSSFFFAWIPAFVGFCAKTSRHFYRSTIENRHEPM